MDHYLIKNNNRFCYIDSNNALRCDNKYEYHDDLATKFAFQSSGNNDARYCIQSKKNNKYANIDPSSRTLVFTQDRCVKNKINHNDDNVTGPNNHSTDTNQFQISFLDVFETTTFTLQHESTMCRIIEPNQEDNNNAQKSGTTPATVQCDGIVDGEYTNNTMFTLLQESKEQESDSMWYSIGSYLPGYSDAVQQDSHDDASDSLYNSIASIFTYNDDNDPEAQDQQAQDLEAQDQQARQESYWYSSTSRVPFVTTNSSTSNLLNKVQSW